jgi:hypothetical protein
MQTRDTLRALTVGARKHFRRELVSFVEDAEGLRLATPEDEGQPTHVFEVVQPTVAERSDLLRRAGIKSGDLSNADATAFNIEGVLLCVKTPALDAEGHPTTGGTEPVFTAHDREGLLAQPAGGWFDVLASRVQAVLSASVSPKA